MEIYRAQVLNTIDQYGGRYLAIGGPFEVIEGTAKPTYPVVIEFPSLRQAHQWYDSAEYCGLKRLRLAAVDVNAVFIQGL